MVQQRRRAMTQSASGEKPTASPQEKLSSCDRSDDVCKHGWPLFECRKCYPRQSKVPVVIPKPVPPADLWQQLDEAIESTKFQRPSDSFTREEFQTQRNISKDVAQRLLTKLQKA